MAMRIPELVCRSSIVSCVLAVVSDCGESESESETKVVQVSAGDGHTCTVDIAGAVTCWGHLDYVPYELVTVLQVSAGGGHTCALDDAGAVTCWGVFGCSTNRAP